MSSVGQKVSGGSSVPTKTEATGSVPSDSLAAESIRSGGGFSANKGAAPGDKPARDSHAGAPGSAGQPHSGSGSLEGQSSYGGAAPSYITSQFMVDDKGPHGKNLKEGGFEGSGTDGSNLPEPGSKQDPARGAEQSFVEGRGVRSGKLENEQPYEALKRDESA